MLKKVVVAGLTTIVIGATGVGAYDAWQNSGVVSHTPRVEAAADGSGYQGNYDGSVTQDQGRGQSRQGSQDDAAPQSGGQGYRGGQSQAGSRGTSRDDTLAQSGSQGYRGGQGGAGRGNTTVQGKGSAESYGSSNESGVPQAQVEEWLTLTGTITSVDQTSLTLTVDDGQTLTLELGQPRFWTSQGVELQIGDLVEVLGFEADEGYGLVFQTATVTRLSDGATIQLRDVNGRPLWAGGGRG